jgi:hypothetical protein
MIGCLSFTHNANNHTLSFGVCPGKNTSG